MDEAITKYYRGLLRTGFQHAGLIEEPSIFLDTVREKYRLCGRANDYMHLYVSIRGETISDVKYLCTCGPTANVAVEILCSMIIGKPLVEIGTVTDGSFCETLGSESDELREKAKGLLGLLNTGLTRYRAEAAGSASARRDCPREGAEFGGHR